MGFGFAEGLAALVLDLQKSYLYKGLGALVLQQDIEHPSGVVSAPVKDC